MDELSQDLLKEILLYDQETGVFTWRVNASNRVRIGDIAGRPTNYGYRSIGIGGRRFQAHRLAWLYMTGSWPSADIDHINLDKADNRWINLRNATRSQNKANTSPPACNTSGLKGVSWHKQRGNWRATIKVNGKPSHLGGFHSAEDAHVAYCIAAKGSFGNFARGK